MKNLITYILILFCTTAIARTPISYYSFTGIDINTLYPFSKQERKNFKEKGINLIETTSNYDNFKSYYSIDKDGNVTFIKTVSIKKEKEILFSTTEYNYNANGLITSVLSKTPYDIYFDTLAYDKKGGLVYYLTTRSPLTKKKKYRLEGYSIEYKMLLSDDNEKILTDSSKTTKYYINTDNICIKVIRDSTSLYSGNRTDSVYFEHINDSTFNKIFLYKTGKDTIYKLGKVVCFQNDFILSETTYNTLGLNTNSSIKKSFTYYNKKLYREENYTNTDYGRFYTYFNNTGKTNDLLKEKIDVNKYGTFINFYKYKFY